MKVSSNVCNRWSNRECVQRRHITKNGTPLRDILGNHLVPPSQALSCYPPSPLGIEVHRHHFFAHISFCTHRTGFSTK